MRKLVFPFILLLLILAGCKSSVLEPATPNILVVDLQQRAHVKITLKNSYMTEIAKLADEDLMPGRHFYSTEKLDLPEGVYISTVEITGIGNDFHEINTSQLLWVRK